MLVAQACCPGLLPSLQQAVDSRAMFARDGVVGSLKLEHGWGIFVTGRCQPVQRDRKRGQVSGLQKLPGKAMLEVGVLRERLAQVDQALSKLLGLVVLGQTCSLRWNQGVEQVEFPSLIAADSYL